MSYLANESGFLMKLLLILGMSVSLLLENIKVSLCKCREWTITLFFLTKDEVKMCINSLIAFNKDKQKVCTLGTVPDRVFIATSCYDVPDALTNILAQWIMLAFAPFIFFNSSGLHYFFLKYTDNFSNIQKIS